MALVAKYFRIHFASKDSKYTIQDASPPEPDPTSDGFDPLSTPRPAGRTWWKRANAKRTSSTIAVPALAAVVRAGDEGVYSSALFAQLPPSDPAADAASPSWQALYDAFAHELAQRPSKERWAWPADLARFVSRRTPRPSPHPSPRPSPQPTRSPSARRSMSVAASSSPRSTDLASSGIRRSFSFSRRDAQTSLVRCAEPLPLVADGGSPSSPDAGASAPWTADLQNLYVLADLSPALAMTPQELTALVLLLGIAPTPAHHVTETPERRSSTLSLHGTGAFGLAIDGAPAPDGTYTVRLSQRPRRITQQASLGSGYSTLFAKHLALEVVPFSQTANSVSAIVVSPESAALFRTGTHVSLTPLTSDPLPAPAAMLVQLPASKATALHTLAPSPSSSVTFSDTGVLLRVLAHLPFTAGLVPLAAPLVAQTTLFAAARGQPAGSLLPRLEDLAHKLHRQAPHLRLFGPVLDDANVGSWTRMRRRLAYVGRRPLRSDAEDVAERAARLARYTTILERLVALLVAPTSASDAEKDALGIVMRAAEREMERAYWAAVDAERTGSAPVRLSRVRKDRVRRSASLPTPPPPPRPELSQPGAASRPQPSADGRRYAAESRTDSLLASPRRSLSARVGLETKMAKRLSWRLSSASSVSSVVPEVPSERSTPERTGAAPSPAKLASPGRRGPQPRPRTTFAWDDDLDLDLGRQAEALLKLPLPFGADAVARVARLVVAAWALGAPAAEWGPGLESLHEATGKGQQGAKGLVFV